MHWSYLIKAQSPENNSINSPSGQNPGDRALPLTLEDAAHSYWLALGKCFLGAFLTCPLLPIMPLPVVRAFGWAVVDGEVWMPSLLSAPESADLATLESEGFIYPQKRQNLRNGSKSIPVGLANRFQTCFVKLNSELSVWGPGEVILNGKVWWYS